MKLRLWSQSLVIQISDLSLVRERRAEMGWGRARKHCTWDTSDLFKKSA